MNLFKKRPYSGTKIYVLIFQISSLLPLIHILYCSGFNSAVIPRGFTSVMFDTGMSAVPRVESLLLSSLYRLTLSEIFVYFTLAAVAFAYGVIMKKLLSLKKTAPAAKYFAAVMICIDVVVRALPFRFNFVFGTLYYVIGLIIRLACLALVISDIVISRRTEK